MSRKAVVYRDAEGVHSVHLPADAEEVTVIDAESLPPRAERARWRLERGRVVLAPAAEDEEEG